MIIPPEDLSIDALNNLLQEFITRDGTDYGELELTLEQKVARLRPQVLAGDVLIIYDTASESVTLVAKRDYRS